MYSFYFAICILAQGQKYIVTFARLSIAVMQAITGIIIVLLRFLLFFAFLEEFNDR
jgi:hypothetical protein